MSKSSVCSRSLIEQALLGAVALALVAMLSLPAIPSVSETFGWLPFWLLALPMTAWAVARVLRRRSLREAALPMATVHAIGGVRVSRAGATLARAA